MGLTMNTCSAEGGSDTEESHASLPCSAVMGLVLKVQTCNMFGGVFLSWDTVAGELLDLKEFPKRLRNKAPNNLEDWGCGCV